MKQGSMRVPRIEHLGCLASTVVPNLLGVRSGDETKAQSACIIHLVICGEDSARIKQVKYVLGPTMDYRRIVKFSSQAVSALFVLPAVEMSMRFI